MRLCTSCIKDFEPVLYSKHMMTPQRDTFKINVFYAYTNSIKSIIYKFKFSKELKLFKTIASLILEVVDLKNTPDLIVPIPSHPIDEIKRGYSHMSIVANYLSKLTGIKNINIIKRKIFPLLRRNQKFKDRQQRLNRAKRFSMRINPQNIKSKRILLIDDVMTTGATASECAQLLLNNGAKSVEVICLALTRL